MEEIKTFNAEQEIANALDAYNDAIYYGDNLPEYSEIFVERLAVDARHAKMSLRNILRKHPAWDESLQAVAVKVQRPSKERKNKELARQIACRLVEDYAPVYIAEKLNDKSHEEKTDCWHMLHHCVFESLGLSYSPDCHEALDEIAPKVWHKGRKPSRMLRDFFKAIDADKKVSNFEKEFAKISDLLSTRKETETLYVSINPAHFLTMSNPKGDKRGDSLTSCHSLNSEYEYRNGAIGYARDTTSIICFTLAKNHSASDFFTRKTNRQMFAYEDGVLMQSRFYNSASYGGTDGRQEESKYWREAVQNVLDVCENKHDLWHTIVYKHGYSEMPCEILKGENFGGYADWHYQSFDPRLSIREGVEPHDLVVGAAGLCFTCGEETCEGDHLTCCDCDGESAYCDECGARCNIDDMVEVINRDGDRVYVCESCRDNYYSWCSYCEEWHHDDDMTYVDEINESVCEDCLERNFDYCEHCDEYHSHDNMLETCDGDMICERCAENEGYVYCEECGRYSNDVREVHMMNGTTQFLCEECREEISSQECEECGEEWEGDALDGECLCPHCHEEHEEDDEEEA